MEDIDRFVAAWHESDDPRGLPEFLGMSPDEYGIWVERPEILPFLLNARSLGVSLEKAVAECVAGAHAADPDEALRMADWLRRTGRAG